MKTHAMKVGTYLVLLYVVCLVWRITISDPAVMNFHLLALKVTFPGFQGYDALSILWGGILTFGYGIVGSLIFHSLHSDCCAKKR